MGKSLTYMVNSCFTCLKIIHIDAVAMLETAILIRKMAEIVHFLLYFRDSPIIVP